MELPEAAGAGPETTGIRHTERETLRQHTPRIYVASLSDYNAGRLHGRWLDANQPLEALAADVTDMLTASHEPQAEEYAIHDYDGFGAYQVGEYDSLEWIGQVARGIAEHGLAFAAWAECCEYDNERLRCFEDAYQGDWSSLTEYAEQLIDDIGLDTELDRVVPEGLRAYVQIDTEMLGRDLATELSVMEDQDGTIHIFDATL